MQTRFARAKDRTQVLSLLGELGEVVNTFVKYSPDNENAPRNGRKNYTKVMRDPNVKIFVLQERGKILGVATFFILPDLISGKRFAHIEDFVITKAFRGRGYGTFLLESVMTYAKRHHISSVKLTTSLELQRAHKFYEKRGAEFVQKVYKFVVS